MRLRDAETLKLDPDGNIIEIGKSPKSLDDIQGQYIGLIKISKKFAPKFFEGLRGEEESGSNLGWAGVRFRNSPAPRSNFSV